MAKRASKTSEWNTWETLPEDGALIIVKTTDAELEVNFDLEAWAGNGGWNDGDVWKLKPSDIDATVSKTATTEPNKTKSKQFSLSIADEDLRRYIADGLLADYGAAVADMWTNADGGFIVYGSGLGKVQS